MKQKIKLAFTTFFAIAFFLVSCDPGHYGKIFIRNSSSFSLKLKYQTHTKDTTIIIPPNSLTDILHFGGLGDGKDYETCVNEFISISLQPADTSVTMTKNITDRNNWSTTNPNTKRFSHKEIRCEFSVSQSDIQ